jgi:DNA-binding SARP family transcriptional activator/tetratricopeptide (TPR) repeat protein
MLRIWVFGDLSVEDDGRSLGRIESGRARGLLAWLALHPGMHPRSRVASQFWPDTLEVSARASLRTTLATLRRELGRSAAGCIVADRERVGIEDGPGVWVDLREFQRLVSVDRGAEALELCRGELLSDLDDDWVLEERAAHRDRTGDVLAGLAVAAEESDDLRLAVRYSRERLALDPLSEEAAQALIRRLARAGDRASAVATYRTLREGLRRELGIQPSAETRALVEEIETEVPPHAASRLPPPLPPALWRADPVPMVGRDDALERLRGAWRQASAGDARMVSILGEAGMGKTRLIAAFALEARHGGATVLAGRCFEDPVAPYGPFAEALRGHTALAAPASAWAVSELGRLIPEAAPDPVDHGDPRGARHRLFEAVALVIGAPARDRPVVLVIEDLHWADPSTILMLAHVTRTVVWAPLLIVGSIRPGEGGEAALDALLGELRRDHRLDQLVLDGLSEDEVRDLVAARLGPPAPVALPAVIHRRTRGNPLFVEETLRHLGEAHLNAAPGELVAAAASDVPVGLIPLIDRRLARLDPPVRDAVAAAAVAGEAFWLADVVAALGVAEEAAAQALDAAAAARLVEAEATPGRFRFAHALVREAVLGGLTPTRRALLHRRIADGIESRADDGRLGEEARHLLDAQPLADRARTIAVVLRAAERSIGQLGYEEAAALLTRALDDLEPDREQRARLLLALGDARARAGESERSRTCFERAADLAREHGEAELFARAALGAAGLSIIVGPIRHQIRALLEHAVTVLDPASPLYPAVLARLSIELYYGPAAIRERLSAEALEAGRRVGGRALLKALVARHVALWSPDHVEERLAIADDLVAAARVAGDREAELEGLNWRVLDLLELGEMTAARAAIDSHARLAEDLRLLSYVWYAAMWRATLATMAGRLDQAALLVEEGARVGRLAHDENAALLFDMQRMTLDVARDRLSPADRAAVEQRARSSAARGAWKAWLLVLSLERGDAGAAARLLAEEVHDLDAIPMDANWLYAMATLAVGAGFLGDAAAAGRLYPRLLPHAQRIVVAGRGASCLGSAAYPLGLLAAARRDDSAAARHLTDAVATNDRIGAAPFAAVARHELARVLERQGDHERARALRDEAAAAGRALEMAVPHGILRRL